ncbi:MAG: hypothetical protein GY937_26155 [bacterium]|nr:hypothetical protein [bacterium]
MMQRPTHRLQVRRLVFSLCGLRVAFEFEDPRTAERVAQLILAVFAGELEDDAQGSAELRIRIGRCAATDRPDERLAEVSRSSDLVVWQTRRGYSLECGGSVLDLDLEAACATGMIAEGLWAHSLSVQREFFLLAFLMLLRRFGRFGLHANCLFHDGRGFLLVGPSGAGKTTLSIALLRQGWRLVADDTLVLRRTGAAVDALALRGGLSCTPQTAAIFPELASAVEEGPALAGGKRLADVDELFPGVTVRQCRPSVILFARISRRSATELQPIDAADAMVSLLEQSPGVLSGRSMAEQHLTVLRQLVSQARRLRCELGSDVLDAPDAAPRALMALGRS